MVWLTVPDDLDGYDYEIYNLGRYLILNYSMGQFLLLIPNTTGSVKKGDNTIENIQGSVCLNC